MRYKTRNIEILDANIHDLLTMDYSGTIYTSLAVFLQDAQAMHDEAADRAINASKRSTGLQAARLQREALEAIAKIKAAMDAQNETRYMPETPTETTEPAKRCPDCNGFHADPDDHCIPIHSSCIEPVEAIAGSYAETLSALNDSKPELVAEIVGYAQNMRGEDESVRAKISNTLFRAGIETSEAVALSFYIIKTYRPSDINQQALKYWIGHDPKCSYSQNMMLDCDCGFIIENSSNEFYEVDITGSLWDGTEDVELTLTFKSWPQPVEYIRQQCDDFESCKIQDVRHVITTRKVMQGEMETVVIK